MPENAIVHNDGPGIPESEQHPLERADETPLEHTSGMRLWLVKWLAEHYDGDVRFEATGAGTTVCLSTPRGRTGAKQDAFDSGLPAPDAEPSAPDVVFGDG